MAVRELGRRSSPSTKCVHTYVRLPSLQTYGKQMCCPEVTAAAVLLQQPAQTETVRPC